MIAPYGVHDLVSQATQPDIPSSPARPATWVENQDTLASQREDMSSIVLALLLQYLRGENSKATRYSNVEDEVHRLSIDVQKECRDAGAAPPDWVVCAAVNSDATARLVKTV